MYATWSLLRQFILVALACVAVLWIRALLRHAEAGSYAATLGAHLLSVLLLATSLSLFFGNFARVFVVGIASVLFADLSWTAVHRILGASYDSEEILLNPFAAVVLLTCPFACAANREIAASVALVLSVIVSLGISTTLLFNLPGGEGMGLEVIAIVAIGFTAMPTAAIALFIANLICRVFDYFHADRQRGDSKTTPKSNITNP